jgi:hypothetical protein
MSYEMPLFDEDFPTEVAFWEANKEELTRQYPGKYLIIRGEEVCGVLNDSAELLIAEQEELIQTPGLVRFVFNQEPVLSPFSQEYISA